MQCRGPSGSINGAPGVHVAGLTFILVSITQPFGRRVDGAATGSVAPP